MGKPKQHERYRYLNSIAAYNEQNQFSCTLSAIRRSYDKPAFPTLSDPPAESYTVLALDPGYTTGYAIANVVNTDSDSSLFRVMECGQYKTPEISALRELFDYILREYPLIDYVVYEDYRIYANRSAQHIGQKLHVAQLIGAILLLADIHEVPTQSYMASVVKDFTTNRRLADWHLYLPGKPHAMDALRHLVYFLAFGSK